MDAGVASATPAPIPSSARLGIFKPPPARADADDDRTSMPLLSTTSRKSHSRASSENGQAMVEFAMVLPILLLIMFAVVEFGMAFWTYQQVSAAASEGARRAIVSRSYSDCNARVQTAVQNASPKLNAGSMNVSTVSTWTPGDPVTVTVTYPENITILGITMYSANLTGRRTMRVEQ